MSHRDLRVYLDVLERRGELVRIGDSVDACDVVALAEPHAPNTVLFEKINGSSFGAVCHLFSTRERTALALGVTDLEQLHVRLARLIDLNIPRGTTALVNRMGEYMDVFKTVAFPPPAPKPAPVQTIVHLQAIDATTLPFQLLYGAQIVWQNGSDTQHVDSGVIHVTDSRTLAVHAPVDVDDTVTIIPMAIVLGGSPAALWSAGAPLPGGIDRYFLAGWLRGRSMTFTRSVSQPLDVLADAECVIEGTVDPHARQDDGAFSMHITAITHRSMAIVPLIVPDRGDKRWMLKATERLFLPLLRLVINEVRDICLPAEGSEVVVVSARVRRNGDAQRIIYGLWGLIPNCRTVIVVNANIDVQDVDTLMPRILDNIDPRRDMIFGVYPGGERVGIDATGL